MSTWSLFGWSFYALDWAIRLVMIPVVAHRRQRPLEAIAWLALIFFIPVIGTLLYLWLAEYTFRRGRRRHDEARRRIAALDPFARQERHLSSPRLRGPAAPLSDVTNTLLEPRLGGLPALRGNAVELVDESDAIDRLVADIEAAKEHVHLLFYLYVADETGWRVARAVADACARGVTCRVLADAWASKSFFARVKPFLAERGVEVHGLLRIHPFRRPLARLDVRNHRKVAVIDGRVGYVGSTNVHDPDYDLDEGAWYQVTVRARGPVVLQLQLVFMEDWFMSADEVLDDPALLPEPAAEGDTAAQVFPSGPAYREDALQHLLTEVLNVARERVVLTTPYFAPDEATRVALRLAAMRGCRVDVVVPVESDRSLADAAGRAFFDDLLQAGVNIHQHPSGILHAKTISVDDALCIVGSANFDRRSLFVNYEAVMLVFDADVTRDLRRRQEEYLRYARPVDAEQWKKRPRLRRIADDTAKLLSPLI